MNMDYAMLALVISIILLIIGMVAVDFLWG